MANSYLVNVSLDRKLLLIMREFMCQS